MQDFHSIPGLIFGGVAGGGVELRRLGGGGGQEAPSAAAKCPRCESCNTKFCYYNNYNLAQPRHFCRSCRRYWTKGGVLRNVPVGGGCRKSSSTKKSSKTRHRSSPASRSSSDSSNLAAATTDTSASSTNPNPSLNLDPVEGSKPPPPPPPPPVIPVADIYSEMGAFTSLMEAASAGPTFLGFGFSDPPPLLQQQAHQRTGAAEDLVNVDLPHQPIERRMSGGVEGLDWSGAAEQSAFDFASATDPGAYWNQGQWDDGDPSSLFLP